MATATATMMPPLAGLPSTAAASTSSSAADMVSISIGGAAIVLPRNHDLVRHLTELMPSQATEATTQPHAKRLRLLSPAPPAATSKEVATTPTSPYGSDSSSSSASTASISASSTTNASRRRRRTANGTQPSNGKKCRMPDCDKISVSRGLCRGHGGGRRCQYENCSKGAQSRSDFCWAHGGGQRCEVPNCMRSRKSKRFCVAHLNWERAQPPAMPMTTTAATNSSSTPKPMMRLAPLVPTAPPMVRSASAPLTKHRLPSLEQALRKHQYVAATPSTSMLTIPSLPMLRSTSVCLNQ